MTPGTALAERRTSADAVFDYLYDEITSLRLLPGAKISEAEIAAQFSVSRQPVRDAFSRLASIDLVQVRPQRATEVKRFSSQSIRTSRFVRAALEVEVIRRLIAVWDDKMRSDFNRNLAQQKAAIAKMDTDAFHALDYQFHELLCRSAQTEFAFDVIAKNKALVDRLCVLSLMHKDRMEQLLIDHQSIVDLIAAGNEAGAIDAIRLHLSRLDVTLDTIRVENAEYFED